MELVLLVIHLILAVALVMLVLVQRSEGGGLGIGGGGGGGLMTSRSQGNLLTRTTWILAGAFGVTSIALAIMAGQTTVPTSFIDTIQTPAEAPAPAPAEPAVPLSR